MTKIGVRELVELTLRSGDLNSHTGSQNTAQRGAQIHRMLQRNRSDAYQKEYYLEEAVTLNGVEYLINGRADGVTLAGNNSEIEEIKTSDVPFDQIAPATLTLYWAQAKVYAYLLMAAEGMTQVTLALTYYQTNTNETTTTHQTITQTEAESFFNQVIGIFEGWLKFRAEIIADRTPSIQALQFPFGHYRPGQHELAAAVYKTILTRKRLFVEAPTGTGKTISTLFPTIKAIGEGEIDRLFYLTAKQSTRQVAEDAVDLMVSRGLKIKSITLTAKDKITFPEEVDLLPEENPYMIGYYDRLQDGLQDMLRNQYQLTRPVIEHFARKHMLDPFEFSLDASLLCDVIICDYNYLFDPRVHLERFFSEPDDRNFFLIDEAHNLVSRSRDMYSAAIDKAPLVDLITLAKKSATASRKLKTAMTKLKKAFDQVAAPLKREHRTEWTGETQPPDFDHALGRFTDTVSEWLPDQPNDDFTQAVLTYFFAANTYVKISDYYNETYRMHLTLSDHNVIIKQVCLDPSQYLSESLKLGHGAVLFSATLSPVDYYETVLGGTKEALSYQLPSPFPPAHQALYITNYIQTTYKQRDANQGRIIRAIKSLTDGKLGNYLIFLPSYTYLLTVSEAFHDAFPDVSMLTQQATMTEADRERFLNEFKAEPEQTLVGFAVLGGSFSEGIDLKADRLIGVGIVSVGLPGMNPETDLLKDYFDKQNGNGFAYAYQLPGLNNVFQAAGRLIRGVHDHGIVLLMDQRFTQSRYTTLFPQHWRHYQNLYRPDQLTRVVTDFWQPSFTEDPNPNENETHA
nr:ATP-dependent DNA helicase [Levilactobacillus bambusae]